VAKTRCGLDSGADQIREYMVIHFEKFGLENPMVRELLLLLLLFN
jgi:hypothetical protein